MAWLWLIGMRICLDTNHWIALARVRSATDQRYAGVLGLLENGVERGDLQVALNHAHVGEVMHAGHAGRRVAMADLMTDLSGGWFLKPRHVATRLEVRDYVKRLLGRPASDRFAEMVGFGSEAMLGASRRVVGRDGNRSPLEPLILSALDTVDMLRLLIAEAHDDAKTAKVRTEMQAIVDDMNRQREEFRRHGPSLDTLRRDNAAELIRHTLLVEVIAAMEEAGRPDLEILTRDPPRTPEDAITQFPSLHCLSELISRRDHDWDRKIKVNDLADVDFLSVAVPYSDVVVCENYFGAKVIGAGLSSAYSTSMYMDLNEFAADLASGALGSRQARPTPR